jgi:RHS repeat-associated protein
MLFRNAANALVGSNPSFGLSRFLFQLKSVSMRILVVVAITFSFCSIVIAQTGPRVYNADPTGATCVNKNITFNYSGSCSSVSWQIEGGTWTIVSSSNTSVTVKWTIATSSAKVTAICSTNFSQNASTNYFAITASSGVASVSISGPTSVCTGASATYTAAPTNGGTQPGYSWKINGVVKQSSTSGTFTSTTLLNSDRVSVTMTSNANCLTNNVAQSNEILVQVNQKVPVSVSISDPTPLCPSPPSGSVTFHATAINGGTSPSYKWFRNGIEATDNQLSGSQYRPQYVLNAGDIINCQVTSNLGCVSSNPATSNSVTISIKANPTAGISPSSSSVCVGDSKTFTAGSNYVVTGYSWSIDNSTELSTASQFTVSNAQANQTVKVVLTVNSGCSTNTAQASSQLTVANNPVASISPTGSQKICTTCSQELIATSGQNYVYQWFKDGIVIGGETNSSITASAAGVYGVNVTSGLCSKISNTFTLIKNVPPVVSAGSDQTMTFPSNSVSLSGSAIDPDGSVVSYQWSQITGPAVVINGATTATASLSELLPAAYEFRLTATDETGESGYDDIIVTVNYPPNNHNYVKETIVQRSGYADEFLIENLEIGDKVINWNYFDGLGRPIQTVNVKASPAMQDIVHPIAYDEFGREPVKFLPYIGGSNGHYKADALTDPIITFDDKTVSYRAGQQYAFYQEAVYINHDQFPYQETVFERSQLNRPLVHGSVGAVWQPNASTYETPTDNTTRNAYTTNPESEVLLFTWSESVVSPFGLVNATSGSNMLYYPAASLFKVKTKDEQHNEIIEFKDNSGKVLLKRVQANASEVADTYYVYDVFDRLVVVIQPEGVKKLTSSYFGKTDIEKNNFLQTWAFRYAYDERNHITQKQVPGTGAVYMVYDDRDRLVLTQDSAQRSTSPYKWLFTKYDALNRPVMTGIKDTTVRLSQSEMQTVVNNFYAKAWPKLYETYIGTSTGNIHGYTNKSYPVITTGNLTVANSYLTVTYYDNYDFKSLLWGPYDYASDGLTETRGGIIYPQPVAYNSLIKGLVTGSKVRVLDNNVAAGNNWLATVNYYDDKYKVIQTISDNYKGGFDKVSTLYDFTGKVLENQLTHYGLSFKSLVAAQNYANKVRMTATSGGWATAGAASVEMLPANQDGWIEFKAASSTQALMVGLADTNPNANWTSIDYALYLPTDGYLQIRENGGSTSVLSPSPQYFAGDVFRIERKGTQINYYRNGSLLRTKTVSAGIALMVDIALNTVGGEVHGLRSSFGSATAYTINRRYEYDAGARLTHVWHKINSNAEVLVTKNEYNELGQLIDKKLHSTQANASDAHQSVDYRYNIRGWLTSMNNAALANDGSTNNDLNDLFGFNLSYNDVTDIGNSALFNGNISAMKWSNNLGLGDLKEKGYIYSYDPLNRIASSNYKSKTSSWTAPTNNGFSETGYTYDLNGNLKSLVRYDSRVDGTPMDNLAYSYGTGGNKLFSVTDSGDDFKGFAEGTNAAGTADYVYDGNGNMVADQNKGITTNIVYNHLNLPITISKGSNTINYVYDATGRKLSQITSYGTAWSSETDYIGEFQYQNHRLQFVNHEEGRVVLSETEAVGTYNGESTSGVTVQGTAAFTLVTQNGTEKYLRVASTGSTSTSGAFPIIGGIPVLQGEQYLLRVKGYRTGSSQVYLIGKVNGTQVLTGSRLPGNTAISESWTEQQITIPANGTLQVGVIWSGVTSGQVFFVNELEVIKLTTIAPEYQYTLKDHLGNVRLTFTSKPKTLTSVAGYESENQTSEGSDFINYPTGAKINTVATNARTGSNSQLLNGGYDGKIGVAKSYSVMPGDVVKIEAYAKYNTESATVSDGTFTTALLTALGLPAPAAGETGTVSSEIANWAGAGSNPENPNEAKLFVNILVFDKDFDLLDAAFNQASGSGSLMSKTYTIKQPGYVFMYVSNENPKLIDAYFDDVTMSLIESPVIGMDDYYPFGLTFNSYNRENSTAQNFKYNGVENEDELGLNINTTFFRMHDPALGRWWQIDPKPREDISPYVAIGNNPILYSDPMGDTTRVYSTSGKLLKTINDSHENQSHFVNKKQFNKMSQGENESTDDYAGRVRGGSVAFIGSNTIKDMQGIVKEANGLGKELGFVGAISGTREIRLTKLPADGSNSSNGIGEAQAQVDNKFSNAQQSKLFLYGHVHPQAALGSGYTETQRAWALGTPTGTSYGGFSPRPVDFYEKLRDGNGNFRPHVGMVATPYGFSTYSTVKYNEPASEVSRTSYRFFKAGKVK